MGSNKVRDSSQNDEARTDKNKNKKGESSASNAGKRRSANVTPVCIEPGGESQSQCEYIRNRYSFSRYMIMNDQNQNSGYMQGNEK